VQVCEDENLNLLLLEISEADVTAFPLEPLCIYQGADPLGGENCVFVSYDCASMAGQFQQKEPLLQVRKASVTCGFDDKFLFYYNAVIMSGHSNGALVLKNNAHTSKLSLTSFLSKNALSPCPSRP